MRRIRTYISAAVRVMASLLTSKASAAAAASAWGPTLPNGLKRTAVITGGNAGLGFETARVLLSRGFRVVIACRSPEKAAKAVADLREKTGAEEADVGSATLDVSSIASVDAFADAYLADADARVDVLLCNAGIMRGPPRRSADGFDLQLATNYLGHFRLVDRLRDRLIANAPSRVIQVSSIAARSFPGPRIDWDDLNFQEPGRGGDRYDSMRAYQQSKLLQVIYSQELAQRLQGTGVTSNSLEPGIVNTNLFNTIEDAGHRDALYARSVSVEEGANTQIMLATSPELEGVSGQHFERGRIMGLDHFNYRFQEGDGGKLWAVTESLLGQC